MREEIVSSISSNSLYFDRLEARSLRLQARINPLLRTLSLQGNETAEDLLKAINYFKNRDGTIGKSAPSAFLAPDEQAAAFGDDRSQFRPSLYKAFLFLHIASAIKSGKLNLQCSYKYRPLDDYLISKQRWAEDKDQLLERAGLTAFADPRAVLNSLSVELCRQYEITNGRAEAEENPHLKFKKDGTFRVDTPAIEDSEIESLKHVFPSAAHMPPAQILATVNHTTGMLDEFQHWQQTNNPAHPTAGLILAGIMGLGCGIGIQKMARISPSIGERELENVINWRFSRDNIIAANDRVVGFMDQMELPNIYRQASSRLHTSSDGQKFEVRAESLNANYSFKYFGKGRGVSAYSFIDERNLLWYSLVFSASERESAYVINGLMHNDVIKSDIHSADSHGFSEAVFGITHFWGISYAPRFADLKKQRIYLFRANKDKAKDWLIKPNAYVNEDVIIANWDDFLRLVVTIKLKEATASGIFRRLNSYSRQHELYRAVKAFGQIIKSIFILRYIDDLELRQAIEKQLNKVELANRFTRAIAVGSPREFIFADKEQQEIAEACNRLIKNCIICWNYLYLTRKLQQTKSQELRQALLNIIKAHSPIAWAHINMLGEYDLSDKNSRIPWAFYLPI